MWNFNGTKIFASKMWIPEKLFESIRNNIVLILISISGPGICLYICVCEEQKIDSANFTIYNILEFFKYRLKNDKFLTWIFLKKLVSISILILMIIVECDTFFFHYVRCWRWNLFFAFHFDKGNECEQFLYSSCPIKAVHCLLQNVLSFNIPYSTPTLRWGIVKQLPHLNS